MANWLEKISVKAVVAAKKANLPAARRANPLAPAQRAAEAKKLPNAAIIYGVAAGGLGAIGLYFLFTGTWFTGALVLFLGACFLGFALHFIKHAP